MTTGVTIKLGITLKQLTEILREDYTVKIRKDEEIVDAKVMDGTIIFTLVEPS